MRNDVLYKHKAYLEKEKFHLLDFSGLRKISWVNLALIKMSICLGRPRVRVAQVITNSKSAFKISYFLLY